MRPMIGAGDYAGRIRALGGHHDPRADDDEDIEASIAAEVFDERAASPAWVQDAFGSFAEPEYQAIVAAYMADDHARLYEAFDAAITRVLQDGAKREAKKQARALFADGGR